MIALWYMVFLAVGLCAGALMMFLYMKTKSSSAENTLNMAAASLKEKISAMDARESELRSESTKLAEEVRRLTDELRRESNERSALVPKAELAAALENELKTLRTEASRLNATNAELKTVIEKDRVSFAEKEATLKELEVRFSDTFKALSADALKSNGQSFMELAKMSFEKLQESAKTELDKRRESIEQTVKPVSDTLKQFDAQIKLIEKERSGAYETLREQIRSLRDSQTELNKETGKLVRALSAPKVRGRWGEIQLRRVVELAGMLDYCDFREQQTAVDSSDNMLRPDMIVKLPGGKNIVVDSKAPLGAYIEAMETSDDEVRKERLQAHARQVCDHMKKLSLKSYWEQLQPSPEFVVLFLPGEMMFSAALEQNPELIEQGVSERVILATPTTLIALLKAVAYGWRQENVAENARRISELGRELYERVSTMTEHFSSVGSNLNSAVRKYNDTVASLEARVLVSARKLRDLNAAESKKEIKEIQQVEIQPRELQSGSQD